MYFILNIAEKHVSRNGANNTRWASFISRVPFEKRMKPAKISFGCFWRNSKKTDNRITSACVWHVTIILIIIIIIINNNNNNINDDDNEDDNNNNNNNIIIILLIFYCFFQASFQLLKLENLLR